MAKEAKPKAVKTKSDSIKSPVKAKGLCSLKWKLKEK